MATRKKAAKKKASTKRPRKTGGSKGLSLKSVAPSFTVSDLQKSIAWYQDVLGCVVKDRWESDGKLMGVELAAGDVTFMLSQDDWKKGRDRVKGEGFRLFCDTGQDADRLAGQIKARGGTLAEEPKDQEWGARTFAVVDPDGFKITIARIKRRGR
ncbi:MAG TPA: VOC family protein [Vicinamibacteria bacterium]|nr:VOC family protein [Vicinamibacteria bacterium]